MIKLIKTLVMMTFLIILINTTINTCFLFTVISKVIMSKSVISNVTISNVTRIKC